MGTLLIYNKDAILRNIQFVSVLLSRSSALLDFSLKKLTCLHVYYASTTCEQTQGPLQKRKLYHWPLMWQGHIDIFLATFDKVGYLSSFAFHHDNGLEFNGMVSSTL